MVLAHLRGMVTEAVPPTTGQCAGNLMIKKMTKTRELTQLDRIERYALLAAKNVLTVEEAAIFLGFSESYVYKMTCTQQLPFYKPNGKMVYFRKAELEEWMTQNRVASSAEVQSEAANYNLRRS